MKFLQHNCCDLFSQLDFKSITVQQGEEDLTQNFPDVFDKKPFPKKSLPLTSQENECPGICCCGGPDHSSLFSSEMNVPGPTCSWVPTSVCQGWGKVHPQLHQILCGSHLGIHCPQRPPTPCWHTSAPLPLPPAQHSASPPCSRRCCPCLPIKRCQSGPHSALSVLPPLVVCPHTGRTARVLTNNEANFTVRVFIATGHHSPNCVIHHSNYIQVKLLRATADPNPQMNHNILPSDPCKGDLNVSKTYKAGLIFSAQISPLQRPALVMLFKRLPFPSPLTLSSPNFIFLHSSRAPDISSWDCLYNKSFLWAFLNPQLPRAGLDTQCTLTSCWRTRLTLPLTNTTALNTSPSSEHPDHFRPHVTPLPPLAGGWLPSAVWPRPHPHSQMPWSL